VTFTFTIIPVTPEERLSMGMSPIFDAMLTDKLRGWHKSAETCNLCTEETAIVQTVTHSAEPSGACVRIILS
jgi:hypothetical protein